MGWDVKATADAIGQTVPDASSLPELPSAAAVGDAATAAGNALARFAHLISPNTAGVVALASIVTAFVFYTETGKAIRANVREVVLGNWRLALLGATGIALSLASGYTTWDGMRNFTGEATLSLLITFGIQGVMLIIAWLIGESFATGMSQTVTGQSGLSLKSQAFAGMLGGLILTAAVIVIAFVSPASFSDHSDAMLYMAIGIGLFFLVMAFEWDLLQPYVQSSRVILKNSVLWVMFLACMITSVFFSFDSLFSAIFPQRERVRAAELRAQNQVAGIIADIGQTIGARHLTAAEQLFVTDGWTAYDTQLTTLAKVAKESEGDVERYMQAQAEARNSAIASQHERIVSAQSGQAGLATKKVTLTDELSRLKAERPTLAAEYGEKKADLDARAKEIDAKRVDAMAEDKGVEGTLKEGKGPIWRQRMGELGKLQDYMKVGEERVKDAKKRLDTTETRLAQIERELAGVDGDLAKLKGEEETAGQRIKMTEASTSVDNGAPLDPSRMLPQFEQSRVDFRQQPTSERLSDVQKVCSQILGAMITATAETKKKVQGLDCDPKQATEAASVLFALNAGSVAFQNGCAGGDKLAQNTSTDQLFGFSRKCLSDSGLPSDETNALRTKINLMELNRDDKAHRFVVTVNAFQDGNRLAYLALSIAIAIDMLVFMSGLFGANAIRSPLSDMPSPKARTAQQLEAIIENALLPDTFASASATLDAMRPISPINGYTQEVVIPYDEAPNRGRILKVLNAASTIGAILRDPNRPERYLVRPELFEFLSVVSKKAFDADSNNGRLAELKSTLTVALQPHVADAADVVLHHLTPISERQGGYSAIIMMSNVPALEQPIVKRAINAGTAVGFARQGSDKTHTDDYEVHKDFYRTLAWLSSVFPHTGWRPEAPMLANARPNQPSFPLKEARDAIGSVPDHMARLTAPVARPANAPPNLAPETAAREREKLAHMYFEQFMNDMGLNPDTMVRILDSEPVREAAADCWNALQSHGQRNPKLASVLREMQRQLAMQFDETYNDLRSAAGPDHRKIDVLDDVRRNIHAGESLLLLLPEFGLIGRLISELEAAAASDNGQAPGEQPLLERLRAIDGELDVLDPADANSWRRIIEEALLQTGDEDIPQVFRAAGKGDGKSRLN